MCGFIHKPVLLTEVLSALQPKAGGTYADGTVGGAGHAAAILEASAPDGRLYGCDRDGAAIEAAERKLAPYAGRFELRRGSFVELADWVPARSCDGVLLDLGVSSPQLDVAERGFSFLQEGPLDMRMDQRQGLTAAQLVNESSVETLANIFFEYGGESQARRIARAIEHDRQTRPFRTTRDLAGLIERLLPRGGKKTHPATRVFQALRIAVNDELTSLQRGLERIAGLVRSGGRFAVITFHSLEDRIVKDFGRTVSRDYTFTGQVDVPELRQPRVPEWRMITRKAVKADQSELELNPRSRSAQLRVIERI